MHLIFYLGPPEISKLWTLVAQIYLSGNSNQLVAIFTGNKRMLTCSSTTEYVTPKDSIFGICVVNSARFYRVFLPLKMRYHTIFCIMLEVKSI